MSAIIAISFGLVLLAVVPLWYGALMIRGVQTSVTWLTEALTRLGEIEREKLSPLRQMADGGAPDALITRLQVVETGLESQKMLVSDAVERVTALGNRVAARQRRQAADFEDEAPETGPTPEQQRALAALLGRGSNGEAPITAPANLASGLSLKERAKAHRAQKG